MRAVRAVGAVDSARPALVDKRLARLTMCRVRFRCRCSGNRSTAGRAHQQPARQCSPNPAGRRPRPSLAHWPPAAPLATGLSGCSPTAYGVRIWTMLRVRCCLPCGGVKSTLRVARHTPLRLDTSSVRHSKAQPVAEGNFSFLFPFAGALVYRIFCLGCPGHVSLPLAFFPRINPRLSPVFLLRFF